jgi:ABC-type multidrug transport system, ATPase and permease components
MDSNQSSRPKLSRESLREAIKIYAFIRPYRFQFFFGLVLLFLGSGVFLVFPAMIGRSLDVAQGNLPKDLDLVQIGLFLVAILAFQGIVSYLRVMMFAQVSERGTADIRVALYKHLISLPIRFF